MPTKRCSCVGNVICPSLGGQTCSGFLVAEGVTSWNLTIAVDDPTNSVFSAAGISDLDGTYSMTWNGTHWEYDGGAFTSGSVTWPAWGCGGTQDPPRYGFFLTRGEGAPLQCKMRLYFLVYTNLTFLTIIAPGNLVTCGLDVTGSGVITLYSFACQEESVGFDFTLEAVI